MIDHTKVYVIGPVSPYRGGIAQYTASLTTALSKIADTTTISFARLYPKVLYPGSSDKDSTKQRIDGVKYSLDSNLPLSWWNVSRDIADNKPDLVLINWWTLFWQPPLFYITKRLKKEGIKVVYLCHNVYDHDSKPWKRAISKYMLRSADGYVVHSTDEEEKIRSFADKNSTIMRPMPIFDNFPAAVKKYKKRGRLEVLFFGFIRPYKGLDVLMDAFKLIDKDIYLSIVGEAWGSSAESTSAFAAKHKNVDARIEYVSDDIVASYFDRADIVAIPYISATGSAVVAAAYSYGKPVLATNVGGLKDAVIPGKTGWLINPSDSKAIVRVVNKISRGEARSMKKDILIYNKENSWDNLATAILEKFS